MGQVVSQPGFLFFNFIVLKIRVTSNVLPARLVAYLRASNNSDIQKRGFKVYMSQKVQ